jgi:IclR family acetate operon transcriptional repressor
MAQIVQDQAGLHDLAQPVLAELVDATNETATLGILQDDHAMVVTRVVCSNQLRIAAAVGTRVPLYCTAAGKSLLANLPEEEADRILSLGMPPLTPLTITSREAMHLELDAIRQRGYAIDRGEREVGLIGISAPVRDVSGAVIATCGVSGSERRMTAGKVPELATHVMAAAMELSKRIGWQPAVRPDVMGPRTVARQRSITR